MPAKIDEIDPETLKKWMDKGEVFLVDVREHLEYNEEHIPKAQLFPSSKFDPRAIPDPYGKKIVFYCHLGMRSLRAAKRWAEFTGNSEALSLKGGICSWKDSGFPTLADKETGSKIEKLVFFWSGFTSLAGIVLGYFFSPWFLWLSVFSALTLIISGIIGHSFFFYLLSQVLRK